jgi:hypothetical protein
MKDYEIERIAERQMDILDRKLLRGDITNDEYDEAVCDICKWCSEAYFRSNSPYLVN